MQSRTARWFAQFDQFGVISQVSFFHKGTQFKTVYGGILSFMIYSLGLAYFLYLMMMWQTHQILPAITTQTQFNSGPSHFKLVDPLFVFSLEVDAGDEKTRQLESKGNIFKLQVDLSSQASDESLQPNDPQYQCLDPKADYDYFDPVCINFDDARQTNLHSNPQNRSQDTYLYFSLMYCDPKSKKNDCLNLKDQSKIFSASSTWRLTLITQDIDLKTGAIIQIPQDYYFWTSKFENPLTFNFDLKVRKATFIVDTGFLFPNEKIIEVVQSFELTTTQNLARDVDSNTPYMAVIGYSLDRQEEIIRVIYPKLGQIMADLGSILQILLLFGLLMNRFNHAQMQVQIEEELLKIYFPQIKHFFFKYDWKGKILSIFYKGRVQLNEDFEQIKNFRVKAGSQVSQKLNFINILHEISRLQISLQVNKSRTEIVQLQDLGYQIPNSVSPAKIADSSGNKILEYEDFLINFFQNIQLEKFKNAFQKISVVDELEDINEGVEIIELPSIRKQRKRSGMPGVE